MSVIGDETPVNWTPAHGPARSTLERASHHVYSHKLLWYIAAVATLALILQATCAR